MPKKRAIRSKPPPSLRERAEAAMRVTRRDVAHMPVEEVRGLVHELQVHQIELEMQNEELRHAQADLAQSRDRFNDLYDFAPVGYLTLDQKGTVLEANLTVATMLGVERTRLVGRKFTRFVTRSAQDVLYLHQHAALDCDEKETCDILLRRADGTTFAARMETICVRGPSSRVCHSRSAIIDITEQKRAEEALARSHQELETRVVERTRELRESERGAHAVLDALTAHIAIVDERGQILAVNKRWRKFARKNGAYPEAVCEGANYLEACEAAAPSEGGTKCRFAQGIRDVLTGRREEYSAEYPCSSATEERWFIMRVTPFPGEGPPRAVISHEDITRRKLSEEQARKSERREHERAAELAAILNTVMDTVITIDRCGIILGVNPAGHRMFGYSEAEMIGKGVGLLMPSPYREEHDRYLEDYHRTREANLIGIGREVSARRKDGTVFPVELMVSEVDHMHMFTGVIRDITARKRLESEVLRIAEEERLHVSADLHDGVCQQLVGINFLANSLRGDLGRTCPRLEPKAKRIAKALLMVTEQTRELARGCVQRSWTAAD